MTKRDISGYMSFLLRHEPWDIDLQMDVRGWVCADALIEGINKKKGCGLDRTLLEEIVKEDKKGRYRFNEDRSKIKACQGHSIPWVIPEMEFLAPPTFLYHGTTTAAAEKIMKSGAISRMSRHAVHMQEDPARAWESACRWHLTPVVLKINAGEMSRSGFVFGKTENDVWCTDSVPIAYVVGQITDSVMFSEN